MIAVLLATAAAEDGTPAALLPVDGVAAVAHQAAQLRRAGASEIHVLARPDWIDDLAEAMATPDTDLTARAAGAPAIVAPVDSTTDALEAIAALLAGAAQAPGSGLVLLGRAETVQQDGVLRGLVRGTTASGVLASTGLVAVAGHDRERVATVADDLALAVDTGAGADDAIGQLLPALASEGLPFAPIDEERLRLLSAVKASDGFFTTFFVSPYSKYLARWAARRGLSPNQVTVFSMLLGVGATFAFARGTRPGLVLGAVLLQLAFTADCVDGQLARYSLQFSKLGGWLDSVFDRGKEYLVYAGLALGATRTGDDGLIWLLAVAALALQTARHAMDFSWATMQEGSAAGRPLLQREGWATWAKRIVVLPIGERFALISVTAAIWNARVTFLALLAWGLAALAYGVAGRLVRTVRRVGPAGGDSTPLIAQLRQHRDDGPLVSTSAAVLSKVPLDPAIAALVGVVALAVGLLFDGRETGIATIVGVGVWLLLAGGGAAKDPSRRTAWMVPPLLRAGEYGLVACLAWRAGAGTGALPVSYALLAAVAFHHYDVVYRLRHQRSALPAWVGQAGFGWEGRSLLVLLAGAAGAFRSVALIVAVWCAVLFVPESVWSWVRVSRSGDAGL